jgi:ABC-type phosphonate transport system ATPase subunit
MPRRPVFELFDTLNELDRQVRRINLATAIVSMHITDVAFWAHRLHAIADEQFDRLGRLTDQVEVDRPAEPYGDDDEDCAEG